MGMKEHIRDKLQQACEFSHIEVINESHLHNTPPDSESHYKVVLVSPVFKGKLPVKRHQLVYGILADELRDQIHALALHTYTAEEWQALNEEAPATPDCKGGSRR